jgi:hypothetical protein
MMPPDSFVPLTAAPASPAPREFRVAILSGHNHGKTGGVPSDGGGKSSVGFQTLGASQAAASAANASEKKLAEPRVSVQRDGDRVTHLRIQCTCGMIMDLACIYDAPPAGA